MPPLTPDEKFNAQRLDGVGYLRVRITGLKLNCSPPEAFVKLIDRAGLLVDGMTYIVPLGEIIDGPTVVKERKNANPADGAPT